MKHINNIPSELHYILCSLQKIRRYGRFNNMSSPCSVYFHAHYKLPLLLGSTFSEISSFVDSDFALTDALCCVHDDLEIITNDIALLTKMKATEEELEKILTNAKNARDLLITKHEGVVLFGFLYEALLIEAFEKKTINAQIVSYLDKVDGLCEAVHEVLMGGTDFLEAVINYLTQTFVMSFLLKKYPDLEPIFSQSTHPIFSIHSQIIELSVYTDEEKKDGRYVEKITGIPWYDFWKNSISQTTSGRAYLRGTYA